MSRLQLVAILIVALPALAVVLWPLRRARAAGAPAPAPAADRALELLEDKAAVLRALKEIQFDHEAGHLSDGDYAGLRARYEGRALQVLEELDRLRPAAAAEPSPRAAAERPAGRRPWTRHPATVVTGAATLLLFGVVLGVNVGRFSAPEPPAAAPAPGASRPGLETPLDRPAVGPGPSAAAAAAGDGPRRPLAPEMLAGMLEAARQSLVAGRYQEAIAAYQAVLKRDTENVDALTHLALIVAIGGHADAALETWARALSLDPDYAPAYLFRGQVLYEVKQDYPGAVRDWERFVALVPSGQDHERVKALLADARGKARP